jgi:branched-chain amino acid transport system ATP-binding protein
MSLLHLDALTAGYGETPIVTDFSAEIEAGSITTIIGANGAGKSTLLRAIFGVNTHLAGRILFDGTEVQGWTPRERLAHGIGLVPQGRCNFPSMSVQDNLELGAYGLRRTEVAPAIARALDNFPMLAAKRRVMAGNLSGGEQQILETAMVLITGPRLLLLDEPSLGLSPINLWQVFDLLEGIRDTGVTVLVVEQNAEAALEISDRAIVMELGRKVMEAPAAEVLADPRVRQAYLGRDGA